MKKYIYLTLILLVPLYLPSSEIKDNDFESTIHEILKAYKAKDTESINKYVHPSIGVYYLVRTGSKEYWIHRKAMCLNIECIQGYAMPKPYSQILLEQNIPLDYEISYNRATTNRDGLFVDNEYKHKLTNTIRKQKDIKGAEHSDLKQIWQIESKSKRITLYESAYDFWDINFTFYISNINNNWYLTFIDFNN